MMVIPSIFIPEDWSFTFYEGLNRCPDSIFKDRTIAELGCGNGWISIAIAEKWLPLKAGDTDISALVEIEKNSLHRFEFFMGLSGDQPICARTTWAYGKAGDFSCCQFTVVNFVNQIRLRRFLIFLKMDTVRSAIL